MKHVCITYSDGTTITRELVDPPVECAHCGAYTVWSAHLTFNGATYAIALGGACTLHHAELLAKRLMNVAWT